MAQVPDGDPRVILAALRETVAAARSMPMSASCVLNRGETLALIDRLGAALPDSLAAADALLARDSDLLAGAREQAAQVLADAHTEVERRLADSSAGSVARAWADSLRAQAEVDAATERSQTEAFVDAKLAHVEAVLVRTLALARAQPASPPDAVADMAAQLTELAAEIEQMLLVVHRGRERMAGRDQMDELGDHLRAMDAAPEEQGAGLGTREELG
ncbi:MAG TPA: hypothetical protein VHV82_08570 [Sporichthyaceae bacterium]|jgi:hypothetical protein|nr:hypothetical protein [Sporichthyaceae bacterium]